MTQSPYNPSQQDAHLKPGPQAPHKYPNTGPNYAYYGEIPGFIYNPFTDRYRADPNAVSEWQNATGQTKPTPGLMETVGPLAAASGAMALGTAAGQQLPGLLGGLVGGGSSAAGTAAGAAGTGAAASGIGAGSAASGVAGGTGAASGGAATGAGMGSGLIGLAPIAGVAGGLALGARGVKDLLAGKSGTDSLGGLGGRATLGIATGGLSELARLGGLFKGETTNVEDKRLQRLKDKGVLPENFEILDEERSRSQQVKDLQKAGAEVPKFLQTGKVEDLTPIDIQGYASLLERNPNDLEARLKDAADALAAGAVKESKGTIDVDWQKVEDWRKAQQQPTTEPVA
jgi:hypothetical protein